MASAAAEAAIITTTTFRKKRDSFPFPFPFPLPLGRQRRRRIESNVRTRAAPPLSAGSGRRDFENLIFAPLAKQSNIRIVWPSL